MKRWLIIIGAFLLGAAFFNGIAIAQGSFQEKLDELLLHRLQEEILLSQQRQAEIQGGSTLGFGGNSAVLSTPTTTQATGAATGSLFVGSILPALDNQFDLGNGPLSWRNATIEGTLTVGSCPACGSTINEWQQTTGNLFITPSTSIGIAVATSTARPVGLFNVDTNGNISSSGTISVTTSLIFGQQRDFPMGTFSVGASGAKAAVFVTSSMEINDAGSADPGSIFLRLKNTNGTSNDRFGIDFTNQGFNGRARLVSNLNSGGGTSDLLMYVGGSTITELFRLSGAASTLGNITMGTLNGNESLNIASSLDLAPALINMQRAGSIVSSTNARFGGNANVSSSLFAQRLMVGGMGGANYLVVSTTESSSGGAIILKDSDGVGCTVVYANDGVLTALDGDTRGLCNSTTSTFP